MSLGVTGTRGRCNESANDTPPTKRDAAAYAWRVRATRMSPARIELGASVLPYHPSFTYGAYRRLGLAGVSAAAARRSGFGPWPKGGLSARSSSSVPAEPGDAS
jgi:hypothetical protein